jgi:CRISPR/Cas system-associated exonuclease Cas4 (RecB family)
MTSKAVVKSDMGATTLRIRNTDCTVASIGTFGAGAVIAIPQELHEEVEAKVFVDALLDLVRAVRNDGGDFSQPDWAASFIVGAESVLKAAVDEAQREVTEALKRADEARGALDLLQRRKLLLTGTGKALEAVVHEAFEALGFAVDEGAPGRTDRVGKHPDFGPVVIEVKGKSKSAAEKDSAQLEKWVAAYLEEHEAKAKAILVVNAWREIRLDERTEVAFPEQMLGYARAREHCLVTGAQLLCAWLEAEAAPDRATELVAELFATSGRWQRYEDWRSWISVAAQATVDDDIEAVDVAD